MYNQTKHEHKKHFCTYCLQCFCSCDNMLKNHQKKCLNYNGQQAIKMPGKGDNMLNISINQWHVKKKTKKIPKKADKCHIRDKKYVEKDITVRDHCFIVISQVNIEDQLARIVILIDRMTVIFNNLMGHDSHFIVQVIGDITKNS